MLDRHVGVLGCGSIGRRHICNLLELGVSELTAYDPSAESRAQIGHRITAVATLDEVWERHPDVVVVATPTRTHLELATAAIDVGAAVFVEKPLSHALSGADDLVARARRRDVVAMSACNMRFHPGPAAVKRLLDRSAVGRVLSARIQIGTYLPGWRPMTDYRASYSADPAQGGTMLDCIHEIDLARWYFGPAHVVGAAVEPATSLGLRVDGLAELLLRHDAGVLSSVHLNFVQRDYRRCCQIIGEDGTIYWDFTRPVVEIHRNHAIVERVDLPADWHINQMYLDEMAYFLGCVHRHEQTFSTLADGLAALALVEEARMVAANEPARPGAGRGVDA